MIPIGARTIAIQRLEVAADMADDEIERLWEIDRTWLVAREWDRLRRRRLAIERTMRRLAG